MSQNVARTLLLALASLCVSAASSAASAADASEGETDGDTFSVLTGVSVQHDDNLFRLASDADTRAILGGSTRADTITVSSLALRLDKSLSLQRFELEAGLEDHRYATFDYLDFTAANYSAIWHWSVTPELHGRLSSTHRESLNSFVDYTGYRTRNVRSDETRRFDSTFDTGGAWHLLGSVDQTTRTNSETFNQEDDSRLTSLEVGVRRDFRSGAALAYVAKTGRGEYVNRAHALVSTQFDNRFDQREDEVSLTWPIDGKLSLDARVAHVERTHEHFSDRDYAGNTGALAVTWRPTAKTSLQAGFRRELSSYQSSNASYISTDRFTLNPLWQITAKTALRGRYDYARRNYRGAITTNAQEGRLDTQQSAAIELEWHALRDLTLSASLQNDRRRSNISGVDYNSTAAGVSARMEF